MLIFILFITLHCNLHYNNLYVRILTILNPVHSFTQGPKIVLRWPWSPFFCPHYRGILGWSHLPNPIFLIKVIGCEFKLCFICQLSKTNSNLSGTRMSQNHFRYVLKVTHIPILQIQLV